MKTSKGFLAVIIILLAVSNLVIYRLAVRDTAEQVANAYSKGYSEGYDYAVKTARLTEETDTSYTIVYGVDDGNSYIK